MCLSMCKLTYLGHGINYKRKNIDKMNFLIIKTLSSSKITIMNMESPMCRSRENIYGVPL